jgi:hypothetical protein
MIPRVCTALALSLSPSFDCCRCWSKRRSRSRAAAAPTVLFRVGPVTLWRSVHYQRRWCQDKVENGTRRLDYFYIPSKLKLLKFILFLSLQNIVQTLRQKDMIVDWWLQLKKLVAKPHRKASCWSYWFSAPFGSNVTHESSVVCEWHCQGWTMSTRMKWRWRKATRVEGIRAQVTREQKWRRSIEWQVL